MNVLPRPSKYDQSGFTLIELLVVITIFAILTGIVLFNQSKFNSTILLTNLAYDTALTIRQAQTYGINIKNFNTNNNNSFSPYGVHFDLGANKSFILYADINYSQSQPTVFHGYTGDPSTCQTNLGCVNRYNITKGNSIKDICFYMTENEAPPGACMSANNFHFFTVNTADIVFVRPDPDAKIIQGGDAVVPFNRIEITLVGQDGSSTRKVTVQSNGLIQILH